MHIFIVSLQLIELYTNWSTESKFPIQLLQAYLYNMDRKGDTYLKGIIYFCVKIVLNNLSLEGKLAGVTKLSTI